MHTSDYFVNNVVVKLYFKPHQYLLTKIFMGVC